MVNVVQSLLLADPCLIGSTQALVSELRVGLRRSLRDLCAIFHTTEADRFTLLLVFQVVKLLLELLGRLFELGFFFFIIEVFVVLCGVFGEAKLPSLGLLGAALAKRVAGTC